MKHVEYFEYTVDGCRKAKEYLKEIDKLEELEKEKSMDGYTLVYLANHFLTEYTKNDIMTY